MIQEKTSENSTKIEKKLHLDQFFRLQGNFFT